MARTRWITVVLLAVAVLAAEASIAVKWGEAIVGVVFLVVQIPLVLAVLAGIGLERRFGRRAVAVGDATPRSNPRLAVATGVVMLVLAALCVTFAVTDGPVWGIEPVGGRGCPGSPLAPVDYDCMPGTGSVYLIGLAALALGGWTMSALRLRRVRIPRAAVMVIVVIGVVLLVAAVATIPGAYPAFDAPGAPRPNDAFQAWAFARELSELRTAWALLTLAVALLAPLAWSRWDRGVRLSLPAVLVGVLNVTVAGLVALASAAVPLLSYFMAGP